MKITIKTDSAAIDKLITSVIKRSTGLQKDMHTVLCSLLSEQVKHGDIRPFIRLVNGLKGTAVKVNAMQQWAERFMPVKLVETEDGNVWKIDTARKNSMAHNLTGAIDAGMAMPFWGMKSSEGDEYQPLDVLTMLNSTIKRLQNDHKKGDHTEHANLIASLLQQVNAYDLASA